MYKYLLTEHKKDKTNKVVATCHYFFKSLEELTQWVDFSDDDPSIEFFYESL